VSSLLLLASCSTSFAYNNLPWLSSFWVDDYIDLNNSQAKQLKHIIQQTRNWHRQVELPKYRNDLLNLQTMLTTQLEIKELTEHVSKAKQHWHNLLVHTKVPLIELAKTLSLEQRAMLINNIKQHINDEQHEYSEQTAQQHQAQRLERQLNYYKEWIGALSSEQVRLITHANEQHIDTFMLWQRYKRNRLAALEDVLLNVQSNEQQFSQQLGVVITQRERFIGDELETQNQTNLSRYIDLLTRLQTTLSAKQRTHVHQHLNDLIAMVNELIEH
jgi:uncharacterized membrane protein